MNFSNLLEQYKVKTSSGMTEEQVLTNLKDDGVSPMTCIKLLRLLYGTSLGEAKMKLCRHEAWQEQAASADALHQEIIDSP